MFFHGTYLSVYFNNLNLSNNEQNPHCRCLRLRPSAHGWLAYASRLGADSRLYDGGSKRRGGETATGSSDCRGYEIRPWHSAGVNQLAVD